MSQFAVAVLARKPRTLDHLHAAAFPLSALMVWSGRHYEQFAPWSAVELAPSQFKSPAGSELAVPLASRI
jgi:hypothetical protein